MEVTAQQTMTEPGMADETAAGSDGSSGAPARDGAAPARHAGPVRRLFGLFVFVALASVCCDQVSKVVVRNLLPPGGEHPLWPGWVHFTHVRNHGAAWGMLSGQRLFLVCITVFVIVVVGRLAREITRRGAWASVGLGLILGGALGNLIDRLLFAAVTDFIDLDTPVAWLQTFPVFNLADSALTAGVTLLVVDLLFFAGRQEPF